MAQEDRSKRTISQSNYEKFKRTVEGVLKRAKRPLTWTEIRERASFTQKVPNNKWVKWMEGDIGSIRQKTKEGNTIWRLP
jgi:hypothetical protein